MKQLLTIVVLVLLSMASTQTIFADSYGNEKKTEFALRFPVGGYSFSDIDNDDFYGDDAAAFSLDFTFAGDNPNISWRIALDGVSSSADIYEDSNNYVTSDLTIGGFSGAVVFHNDRKEKIGVYGGIGLGFYNVTEDGSGVIGSTPFIIDGKGSGTGVNLFGGVNVALSDSFSLGLEYFIRNLKVADMGYGYEDVDYGGQSLSLTLGFSFQFF